MIVAKTRMKKIPKTCKDCSCSVVHFISPIKSYRVCVITSNNCPMVEKSRGNYGYGKPKWCPLIVAERI